MNTLDKIRKNKKVALVSDERSSDSGVWAELRDGWINPHTGTHSVHEDTPADVYRRLRDVIPCDCGDCTK